MRILTLTDYFYPHVGGGVERVVYEIGRRLVRDGHEIRIITFNTAAAPEYEVLEGIHVHRAGAIELTRLIGMQSSVSLQALPLALRVGKVHPPDIIHAHNLFFATTAMAPVLARSLRRPLVTTLHTGSVKHLGRFYGQVVSLYERTIGKAILRRSERIIAVSKAVGKHGAHLGVEASRLHVIPNGVDLERFRPRQRGTPKEGEIRIVFVGRLISNKGPQYLVEAIPSVLSSHPKVEFVFVGDGPLRPSLERRARALRVDHKVKFLGLRNDVASILGECDIFVRPSLLEGMPLTVLEAMACSLPVIATAVGGTPELVSDGVTGLLVEPANHRELANAILRLVGKPSWARELGSNGHALVEKAYDWDIIAEQTLEVYRELASTSMGTTIHRKE